MAKTELQKDIRALLDHPDRVSSLPALMDEICGILSRHTDDLSHIDHRYRLETTDTGYVRAFALKNGVYQPLGSSDAADVSLLGREEDLLRIFRGELTPMAALLRGKVKIRGSKSALMQFAEFL